MARPFQYSSFFTTYSAKIEGGIDVDLERQACFAQAFLDLEGNRVKRKGHYKIFINKNKKLVEDRSRNNYCFLTRKELCRHVNLLKKVMEVTFKVEEHDDYFTVIADIDGYCPAHKYMLTWVRYAYEYPYNVMCLDVNHARKEKEFRFVSKVNLFNVLCKSGFSELGGGHSLVPTYGTNILLKTNSEIKTTLNKYYSSLHDTFKGYSRKVLNYENIDKHGIDTLDREEIENSYNKRIGTYKRNYNECLRCRR